MKIRARCVDGPFAGQTLEFSRPKINYATQPGSMDIGPLMWINYGPDRHCYQLVSNGWMCDWRLVYRDTF